MVLALIAGQGELPIRLAKVVRPEVVCALEGYAGRLEGAEEFRIEHLGSLLNSLKDRGVTDICLAGAVRRPVVDPSAIDAATQPLVTKLEAALSSGDDRALRTILGFFEDSGFRIVAAHDLLPDLLPPTGIPTLVRPDDRDRSDAARAAEILAAMGNVDVGQACCVAKGQTLAIETLGGTDWMLSSLAGPRRPPGPSGGILYKAPKSNQDRRVDLPAIGTDTVTASVSAGLSGIVIEARGVMVLDPSSTVATANAAGLFLWVREP